MGLFSNNKKLCPVCGNPTPRLLATKIQDTPICKECDKKIYLPKGRTDRMTIDDFKQYIQFYEDNQALRDQFEENYSFNFGLFGGDLVLDIFHGLFRVVPYGVNDEGFIDYDKVREIALECKPKMIIAGASAYARTIDFKKFREIADEVNAVLMVDMAHIAGLVAAGLHPSPIPYADVVTTTTHKTLRGPRGGMILCSDEVNKKYNFNKAIFPGTQGGPLMHVIAAKAVCFEEALKPEFKTYQEQIIKNAQALCKGLQKRDVKIVSGGTDNHLMLVDLTPYDLTGKVVEKLLDSAHITANKNTIPNDPQKPFVTSGIRLGTPAATSRGLKEDDFDQVAEAIAMLIKEGEPAVEKAKAIIKTLTDKYPLQPMH